MATSFGAVPCSDNGEFLCEVLHDGTQAIWYFVVKSRDGRIEEVWQKSGSREPERIYRRASAPGVFSFTPLPGQLQ